MNEPKHTVYALLTHIVEEDISPRDVDLWPRVSRALAVRSHPPAPTHILRPVAVGGLIIVLALTALALLPEGRALAAAIKQLFIPASAGQFPTPSARELAAPTYAPTFVVTLSAVESSAPTLTAAPPVPDVAPGAAETCAADPYSYRCKIARAESDAGFDAMEFPAVPQGFTFAEVAEAKPGVIILRYNVIGGGGYLYLTQGTGEPRFRSTAPEASAIERVTVNANPGEYVYGDWAIGGIYKTYTWLTCCRARLRWQAGGRWYELDKQAAMPQTEYMTREVMLDIAAHLVEAPPVAMLNPEYLTLEEIMQLAGFDTLTPAVLPKGFAFGFARYDENARQVTLHYYPNGDAEPGSAEITITETLFTDMVRNSRDGQGEPVQINGYNGNYLSGGPQNHAITWRTETLEISLAVYANEYYGGQFTREQVLKIARSMR